MEEKLFAGHPTLCATPIVICRHLVLQQALKAVGLSMNQMTTRDDELNEIVTVVQIQVPPQIRLPRLETTNFYGDWCVTTEAALQSACSNALAYLQKAAIVTIDCIHSAELKDYQRKLLETSSWAEAFQDHAAKLQSKLDAIAIETKDSVTENKPFAKKTMPPLPAPDTTVIPQGNIKKEAADVTPLLATPAKSEEASSSTKISGSIKDVRRALLVQLMPMKIPMKTRRMMPRRTTSISVPSPSPEHAAISRKNRRLLVDSNHSKSKVQKDGNKGQKGELIDNGFAGNALPLPNDTRCGTCSPEKEGDAVDKENNP